MSVGRICTYLYLTLLAISIPAMLTMLFEGCFVSVNKLICTFHVWRSFKVLVISQLKTLLNEL